MASNDTFEAMAAASHTGAGTCRRPVSQPDSAEEVPVPSILVPQERPLADDRAETPCVDSGRAVGHVVCQVEELAGLEIGIAVRSAHELLADEADVDGVVRHVVDRSKTRSMILAG